MQEKDNKKFILTSDFQDKLEEIRNLKKMIGTGLTQIDNLKTDLTYDVVSGSGNSYPYLKRRFKIEGMPEGQADKKEILETKLTLRVAEYEKRKQEILLELEEAEGAGEIDRHLKEILIMRFIEDLRWDEIGKVLKYKEPSGPRKRVRRFLRRFEAGRGVSGG